jgi:hypothetical protein
MDPNACLNRILVALDERDTDEALEALDDLQGWLSRGGFPPSEAQAQRLRDFLLRPVDYEPEAEARARRAAATLVGLDLGEYELDTL